MVQCRNCHRELAPDAKFCDACGTPVFVQSPPPYQGYQQPYPPYPPYPYVKEKEPILALLLSFIIPGIGQIYCGRILRGILIFLFLPILMFVLIGPMFLVSSGWMFSGFPFIILIIMVIWAIVWFWQIYDAYSLANKYNEAIRRTGRAPW